MSSSQRTSTIVLTVLGLLCDANGAVADHHTVLVKDGQANAVIVVPDNAAKSVTEAAEACRNIIEQITGAKLPIQSETQDTDSGTVILVGQSELARQLGVDLPQNVNGPEHYTIRTIQRGDRQYLALVGNDKWHYNRGSAFAVYDLFWRLGCGWYAPDDLWHVIPKRKTLSVDPIDEFQSPAFEKRSLWLRGHERSIIRNAWRLDGREVANGHNLGRLVPVKEYPQYFDPKNPGNPSMTHPEVIKIIVEKFRKQLDESKAPPDYRVPLSLTPADTDRFYRHPDAPKVGNTSAELMYMTNAVARELQKSHPDRFLIGTLAYWVTHGPPRPMIKAEPGVTLMIVNEGNHTKPLEYPILHERRHSGRSNHRVNTNFRKWQESGAMEGIYEWWLPGINGNIWGKLPWFSMYTAAQNLQLWHRKGVKYMLYEAWAETEAGFFSLRWPTYYVAARCMWDAGLTHEEIMTDACRNLYGPAASEMWKYYNTVEKAMLDCPQPTGNWGFPSVSKVFTPEYEALAEEHMQKATELARQGGDPDIVARVGNQQKFWAQTRQIIAGQRTPKE